jgi:hypothetical protein
MKLKYETAIATLIQFVALTVLNVGTGADSIITTCHSHGSDCLSNTIVSLIFFLLAAAWFGFVWVLGYAAQERRSKRLSQLLIIVELMIGVVALFNAKHHTDILSLLTSLTDLALVVWVISLAFRLMRADGGRITTKTRPRKRRRPADLVR